MTAKIDHLVIAASSLNHGIDYVREILDVEPTKGGEHITQGTHNALLRLGNDCYLEIIAINPKAPQLSHPRWFNLDCESLQGKLAEKPRLITWVAQTNDICRLVNASHIDIGEVKPMSRGTLNWHMTFTHDGSLIMSGQVPPLIQWQTNEHPASNLPDCGCHLDSLTGYHPQPDEVSKVLSPLGLLDEITLKTSDDDSARLTASIMTPSGLKNI